MSAKKKPTVKTQQEGTYVQVETGIYRYKDREGKITYHERPWIISRKGKPSRTYRALGVHFTAQSNLGNARAEYHRRRAEVAAGKNPYEEKADTAIEQPTVSVIVSNYAEAGYPDRYLKKRTGRTLETEESDCKKLLRYWKSQAWDEITPQDWDDYHTYRLLEINGEDAVLAGESLRGDRAVDLERNSLINAYKYAIRKGKITSNPVLYFPKFRPSSEVRHCREFAPQNADELHRIGRLLFELGREELAWQLLIEANSALRTSEVLQLRTDAREFGQPGYVDPEGNLHVGRIKKGINPFVHINSGLSAVLEAHAAWHAVRHPDNPWFIPGEHIGQPMGRRALALALYHIRNQIGRKITSHGMRAFYVLIRRSWGINDAVIAVELGQGSGAGLIATTYGDVPPNWRNGGGPKLSWLPEGKPAWAELEKNGWKSPKAEAESVKLAA